MAEELAPPLDQDLAFTLVTETYASPTKFRRRSPGADITKTGYTQTNVNGTAEFGKLVHMVGGTWEDLFVLTFGVNESKGVIALRPAGDSGAPCGSARTTPAPPA